MVTFAVLAIVIILLALTHFSNFLFRVIYETQQNFDKDVNFIFYFTVVLITGLLTFGCIKWMIIWGQSLVK